MTTYNPSIDFDVNTVKAKCYGQPIFRNSAEGLVLNNDRDRNMLALGDLVKQHESLSYLTNMRAGTSSDVLSSTEGSGSTVVCASDCVDRLLEYNATNNVKAGLAYSSVNSRGEEKGMCNIVSRDADTVNACTSGTRPGAWLAESLYNAGAGGAAAALATDSNCDRGGGVGFLTRSEFNESALSLSDADSIQFVRSHGDGVNETNTLSTAAALATRVSSSSRDVAAPHRRLTPSSLNHRHICSLVAYSTPTVPALQRTLSAIADAANAVIKTDSDPTCDSAPVGNRGMSVSEFVHNGGTTFAQQNCVPHRAFDAVSDNIPAASAAAISSLECEDLPLSQRNSSWVSEHACITLHCPVTCTEKPEVSEDGTIKCGGHTLNLTSDGCSVHADARVSAPEPADMDLIRPLSAAATATAFNAEHTERASCNPRCVAPIPKSLSTNFDACDGVRDSNTDTCLPTEAYELWTPFTTCTHATDNPACSGLEEADCNAHAACSYTDGQCHGCDKWAAAARADTWCSSPALSYTCRHNDAASSAMLMAGGVPTPTLAPTFVNGVVTAPDNVLENSGGVAVSCKAGTHASGRVGVTGACRTGVCGVEAAWCQREEDNKWVTVLSMGGVAVDGSGPTFDAPSAAAARDAVAACRDLGENCDTNSQCTTTSEGVCVSKTLLPSGFMRMAVTDTPPDAHTTQCMRFSETCSDSDSDAMCSASSPFCSWMDTQPSLYGPLPQEGDVGVPIPNEKYMKTAKDNLKKLQAAFPTKEVDLGTGNFGINRGVYTTVEPRLDFGGRDVAMFGAPYSGWRGDGSGIERNKRLMWTMPPYFLGMSDSNTAAADRVLSSGCGSASGKCDATYTHVTPASTELYSIPYTGGPVVPQPIAATDSRGLANGDLRTSLLGVNRGLQNNVIGFGSYETGRGRLAHDLTTSIRPCPLDNDGNCLSADVQSDANQTWFSFWVQPSGNFWNDIFGGRLGATVSPSSWPRLPTQPTLFEPVPASAAFRERADPKTDAAWGTIPIQRPLSDAPRCTAAPYWDSLILKHANGHFYLAAPADTAPECSGGAQACYKNGALQRGVCVETSCPVVRDENCRGLSEAACSDHSDMCVWRAHPCTDGGFCDSTVSSVSAVPVPNILSATKTLADAYKAWPSRPASKSAWVFDDREDLSTHMRRAYDASPYDSECSPPPQQACAQCVGYPSKLGGAAQPLVWADGRCVAVDILEGTNSVPRHNKDDVDIWTIERENCEYYCPSGSVAQKFIEDGGECSADDAPPLTPSVINSKFLPLPALPKSNTCSYRSYGMIGSKCRARCIPSTRDYPAEVNVNAGFVGPVAPSAPVPVGFNWCRVPDNVINDIPLEAIHALQTSRNFMNGGTVSSKLPSVPIQTWFTDSFQHTNLKETAMGVENHAMPDLWIRKPSEAADCSDIVWNVKACTA